MHSHDDYDEFIRAKVQLASLDGFEVTLDEINDVLKPHQKACVQWAVRGGRRALFESFGLGKSVQQLEILRLVREKSGGSRSLIVAPLGVKQEFARDLEMLEAAAGDLRHGLTFVRRTSEVKSDGCFITNYESVRDGKLNPKLFDAGISLDEADVLRGFGGSKTFREFMALFAGDRKTMNKRTRTASSPWRFVATATPSPNEYEELLAYAAFLDIADIGQCKTRFFKRDSTKADKLTLHPHKEREFWLWVSSWAMFLQRPSDLGFPDTGYSLPEMKVVYHEIPVDHTQFKPDKRSQVQMFREATGGVVEASREKRETMDERVIKMKEIVDANPEDHFLLWHDLENERRAIDKAIPDALSVYGSQKLDEREQRVMDFSDGQIKYLSAKPSVAGSGCNFQRHCHRAIFVGIGFKFKDFIQAVHRIQRFLQTETVQIDVIYAESERRILQILLEKWERHKVMVEAMSTIIREYGLSHEAMHAELARAFGVERQELTSNNWTCVNNDCVVETRHMEPESVHLVLTSIPFSSQYEYSPNFNDFGHTDNNEKFFQQMDFLTPELLRVLQPGRIAAIHLKDRIVPGSLTGLGFQTVYPFHSRTIDHYVKHGFGYLGMVTIVTDVVRENSQTYRLGWTEQCKDGTKMGVGMPEYLLLFRKPPTDTTNAYADTPVVKSKDRYTRSRWQIDAHGFHRSSGDRLLDSKELLSLPHHVIFKLFRDYSLSETYNYENHVQIGEMLEREGKLPPAFMLLQPQSWHPEVWTDITRMRTLNSSQAQKGKEMHLCPLQLDLVDRVVEQYTNPGEVVYDPFGGIGTVASRAVLKGRKGYSVELAHNYWQDSAMYCRLAEEKVEVPGLFDVLEAEAQEPEFAEAAHV